MSSMAACFVRTDEWNADVFGSASAAYRISAAVKQGHNVVQARLAFGRLNHLLDGFFESFFAVIENAQNGVYASVDREPMTSEEVRSAIDKLWNMHSALDMLYDLSLRKGLRKKSLFTNQIKRLEASRERVIDLIQWMEYSVDKDALALAEKAFSLGVEELQRGETVTVG